METTPTNSRSGSVGANGHRRSLSPASSVSGSSVKSLESNRIPSPASVTRKLFPGSSNHNGNGKDVFKESHHSHAHLSLQAFEWQIVYKMLFLFC